jgi:2-C-methyl-D-erythritol 2,4-cyclodiphosphate synthase
MSPSVRIGTGLDVHPFADPDGPARPLVLAGVVIPDATGLAGHSDADVVAHAVTDALLGSLALGDLGSRFGVDTAELAGADSMVLLAEAHADLTAAGWQVGNLDVVVVVQRPRLAEHRDAMRAGLAAALDVPVDRVSVKATTTDRLGTIGRGEGIGCWATVLAVTR